jgi:hypothetical protein
MPDRTIQYNTIQYNTITHHTSHKITYCAQGNPLYAKLQIIIIIVIIIIIIIIKNTYYNLLRLRNE